MIITERASLEALRDLIEDASLTLETTPDQNGISRCRETLAAAILLANDIVRGYR
jgi:hypothetical protein